VKKLVTILLIGTFLLALSTCTNKKSADKQFQSYEVTRMNLVQSVEANGSVEMKNNVAVFAPTTGRMEKVLIKEGDHVRKGQRLAVMSSSTRSTLLDMAAAKGKEEKKYWKEQILPTTIFSPVSGQVLTISTEAGERIRSSVMMISTGMLIRANVDETDLPSVFKEQPAKIVFDISDSEHIMGKVIDIARRSKTVNNVNVYVIETTWEEEELQKLSFDMRIGMSVTLLLEVSRKENADALPVTAVNGRSNTSIQAFDKNLNPIELKIGDIYGEFVEVLEGASESQTIKVAAFSNPSDDLRESPLLIKKK